MKKWMVIMALMPLLLFANAPEVEISPNPIYAGEYGQITVRFEKSLDSTIAVPSIEGIRFLSDAFQRIPPGNEYGIPFVASTPGTLALSDLKLTHPDTAPFEIPVPDLVVLDNGIAGRDVTMTAAFDLTTAYDGQKVPFSVSVWVDDTLTVSKQEASGTTLGLEIPGVKWRRQAGAQKDSRITTILRPGRRNGRDFLVIQYRGSCFPTQIGELTGAANFSVPLLVKDTAVNKFASMFNSAPQRKVWIPVDATFEPIPIKPLPPPPASPGYQLGLIGDFSLNLWTNKTELTADDLLALTLTVTGSGNLEHIQPPDLQLNGWTVYEPTLDVRPDQQRAELKWLLQPMSDQARLPDFTFSFFSVTDDKWQQKTFRKTVTLKPVGQATALNQLPLAPNIGRGLYTNVSLVTPFVLLLFLVGPALVFARYLRKSLQQPAHIQEFNQRRHRIIKQLESTGSDVSLTLSNDVLPALRSVLNLPPGASLEVIQDHLHDDELKQCLDRLHPETYQPKPKLADRREIIHRLSAYRPVLVFALLLPFLIAAAVSTSSAKAYLSGDYATAIDGYKEELHQPSADVSALINLGNSYFMDKQYAHALLCAERSIRIAPRDLFARRLHQKCLPKLARGESSRTAILLPREWATVAAVFWLAAWLIIATIWKHRTLATTISLVILISAACLALGIGIYEQHTTYNVSTALVVSDSDLFPVPGAAVDGGVALSLAETVEILEERAGWVHVKSSLGTGWIPRNAVGRLILPAATERFESF